MQDIWVAGVDGCKGGWLAVFRPVGDAARAKVEVFEKFEQILDTAPNPRIVAVDMPIGLPEHTGPGGRGPEVALRRVLGKRRSSVFSVPSRRAVYAYKEGYPAACKIAHETSEPQRKVSQQAFHLFPKVQEIDRLLLGSNDLVKRVFECHPEGSFRMMAGAPLQHPKKRKSRVYEDGFAERRDLLLAEGYSTTRLDERPPKGAGRDDLLDACAAAWTAARLLADAAHHWPCEEPIQEDAYGLPMTIWT